MRTQVGTNGLLVSGLKDWIAGDTTTTAEATGTYGLYVIADQMAQMAAELGKTADAADYRALATSLGNAFNAAFYNPATKTYAGSQAMAALPLAMGIVPADAKQSVLDSLVERIYAYHPGGSGPHMSGGTVSLQATYRVLMEQQPRRRALGRPAGAERAELRELLQPGSHHDPRVVGLRGLAEPHDPAADRRVVRQGPRPASARRRARPAMTA